MRDAEALYARNKEHGAIMTTDPIEVHESAANIFADLGLPDAETHFLKAQIVAELYRLTRERGLTQAKAGALMGISQPEVSRLFKGSFREYSVDRLMTLLTAFDRDVEIISRPRSGSEGRRPDQLHAQGSLRKLGAAREELVPLNDSPEFPAW